MKRPLMMMSLMMIVLVVSAVVPMGNLAAHCEVPCGIYDDGARFKRMMEDQSTIAKAIAGITGLTDANDSTGHNQLARWVATKESHATNIQHIIAQYFMTQRIKAADAKYVEKLSAAHAVMVAAMKCKQAADPATAKALDDAIHDFQHAYGGEH